QAWQVARAGPRAYECARIGEAEAEVVAAVEALVSPHAVRLEYGDVRALVAHEGVAPIPNDEVTTEQRADGSVLYRRRSDGQVVGWARGWDTPRHSVVVLFGPDSKVIGRTLWEEAGSRGSGSLERVMDCIKGLF